jgi:hypothetical protein
MPPMIPNDAYDAYFAFFEACTRLDLVSDADVPVDLSNTLADTTIDPGADYAVEAGDPDGRKLTVAAKAGVDVTGVGTTKHAVLSYTPDAGVNWALRLVTTCSERAVSDVLGDKVNMGSFSLQVGAPVVPV